MLSRCSIYTIYMAYFTLHLQKKEEKWKLKTAAVEI